MEKLIELLNEYIKEKELGNTVKEIDDDFFVNNYNNWDGYLCEQVMSKKFGFIERLVKNDKIDFSWEGELANELVALFERKLDNADGVIALLSIKDNPIEYLCSILKE